MDINRWFKKRTYGHVDYANLKQLVEKKKAQGAVVSVCLPTLNSGKTLGFILRVFKEILVDEYPLIDELAIVDSHSTDNTIDIAKKFDVSVFYDDKYLKHLPKATGKGEALWKSLYFLKGDIICWVDSDIKNIHPRFAYGPIGVLLNEPKVGYVKGFYSRPIRQGGVTRESGGGRVTEIMARPFLNLFYPELSGLIQPLSGEYAGRREILESVPFFTGYGVETGLLIDILNKYGLDAIAQVNLEKRIHANQTTKALGRMSFGIMQAAFQRLEEDKKVKLKVELNRVMQIIKRNEEGYYMMKKVIKEIERPPMITIKEYQEKRKA